MPFKHTSIKPTNLQLIQLSKSKEFIENFIGKCKFEKNPRNAYGVNYLEISGLKEGLYQLWLKKENVKITVNVYSGQYWNSNPDFIIQERMMIERSQSRTDPLRIDNIEIKNEEIKDENDEKKIIQKLRISLGGVFNPSHVKVHAWAFKFFP